MKTRDFNINNYDLVDYHTYCLNELHGTITYRGFEIQNSFNRYKVPEEIRKLKIEDYSIEERQKIHDYFLNIYEIKKNKTIERFNSIKKEADFIFEDDKKYGLFIKDISNSYYCQASTFIIDYINKVCNSKASSNLRFKVRRQQYSNTITCD